MKQQKTEVVSKNRFQQKKQKLFDTPRVPLIFPFRASQADLERAIRNLFCRSPGPHQDAGGQSSAEHPGLRGGGRPLPGAGSGAPWLGSGGRKNGGKAQRLAVFKPSADGI